LGWISFVDQSGVTKPWKLLGLLRKVSLSGAWGDYSTCTPDLESSLRDKHNTCTPNLGSSPRDNHTHAPLI